MFSYGIIGGILLTIFQQYIETSNYLKSSSIGTPNAIEIPLIS